MALDNLEKSFSIRKQCTSNEFNIYVAASYSNLGMYFRKKGNFTKSMEYL